jgi:hypothetical protein
MTKGYGNARVVSLTFHKLSKLPSGDLYGNYEPSKTIRDMPIWGEA